MTLYTKWSWGIDILRYASSHFIIRFFANYSHVISWCSQTIRSPDLTHKTFCTARGPYHDPIYQVKLRHRYFKICLKPFHYSLFGNYYDHEMTCLLLLRRPYLSSLTLYIVCLVARYLPQHKWRSEMRRFSDYARGVYLTVGLLFSETWVGGGAPIADSRLYLNGEVKVVGWRSLIGWWVPCHLCQAELSEFEENLPPLVCGLGIFTGYLPPPGVSSKQQSLTFIWT